MQVRKIFISIIVGVALFTFGASRGYCADVAKIGTVNFERIFNNSAGGKAVKNKINEEGRGMNADLEKLQKEIKSLQELLSKDESAGVMNQSARENKAWELERKIDEVKALKKPVLKTQSQAGDYLAFEPFQPVTLARSRPSTVY